MWLVTVLTSMMLYDIPNSIRRGTNSSIQLYHILHQAFALKKFRKYNYKIEYLSMRELISTTESILCLNLCLLSSEAKLRSRTTCRSVMFLSFFNRTASLVDDPRNGIPIGNGVSLM